MRNTTRLSLTIVLGLIGGVTANAQTQPKTFEQTADFAIGSRLALEAGRGSVQITPWDNETIEIRARIEAPRGEDSDRAREAVENTTVEVRGSRRSMRIRTRYDGLRGNLLDGGRSEPLVHYQIRVPRQLDLDLDLDRCDTTVSGLEGRLFVKLSRGDLSARDLSGTVTLEVSRGALTAHNLSGAIWLALDRGQRMTLDGLRGSLELDLDRTNGTLREVDLEDHSRIDIDRGNLQLHFVDDQTLTIDADIDRRAEFVSDPPLEMQSSRRRLHGTLNGGGPNLRLEADRGRVEFHTR